MLGFFVAPAILWVILFIVARHRGDSSYSTLFFVSLGVTVAALVFSIFIPDWWLPVTAVVCVLVVQKFCYIGWIRSIIAAILYLGWMIVWPMLFNKMIH